MLQVLPKTNLCIEGDHYEHCFRGEKAQETSEKTEKNFYQWRTTARVRNDSEQECRELISNFTSVFNRVNLLMRRLFTEEEIISHSVSGKASHSKTLAKPKFNLA